MEIWNLAEPLIQKHEPKIAALVNQAGGALTDDVMLDIAGVLHALLPFPAKMAVSRSTLATLLISNKGRISQILQSI